MINIEIFIEDAVYGRLNRITPLCLPYHIITWILDPSHLQRFATSPGKMSPSGPGGVFSGEMKVKSSSHEIVYYRTKNTLL